ncbi:MAG: hypothetical protein NC300_10945 [Bacteroidales bacterium]|nr:hypothetical protein [Clostridium sp.]MCM1204648.1 hypothetical protein [Bacteroidales bacterium]
MKEKKKSRHWLLWTALAIFVLSALVVEGILFYRIKEYRKEASTREELPTREEKRKQEALAYLEERYGEEFEIDSYRGMGYAYDYVQMYAYPKAYHDEAHKFQIQGRINDEGKMEYVDGYVMVRLTDEYASYVDEIIDEYFDDYKFYLEFYSEWMTNELPPDTTVEDLLKLRANVDYPIPQLAVLMKSSQKENFTEEHIMDMGKKLAKWGYRGEIYLFYYSDDLYYEKKNNENKRECLEGEKFQRKSHRLFIRDEKTIDYR